MRYMRPRKEDPNTGIKRNTRGTGGNETIIYNPNNNKLILPGELTNERIVKGGGGKNTFFQKNKMPVPVIQKPNTGIMRNTEGTGGNNIIDYEPVDNGILKSFNLIDRANATVFSVPLPNTRGYANSNK